MTFLTRLGFAAAAVAAALATGGAAEALQIVQTTGYATSGSASSGNDGPVFTDILDNTVFRSFARFDTANGTLDSVRIEIFGIGLSGSADAKFVDLDLLSTAAGISRLQNMSMAFSATGGFGASRGTVDRSDACTSPVRFGAASCFTSVGFSEGLASIDALLTGGLSGFIGAGTFSMTIQQSGQAFHDETNGDDGFVDSRSASLSSSGTIRVTYNFTAPPPPPPPPPTIAEPASLGVLGLGVLGLAALRRRRRRL